MRAPRHLFVAALCLLAAAAPAARAAADNTPPAATKFGVTDCEGNLQYNTLVTSTGTPSVITVTVQDTGTGLRFGQTEHVGGSSAGSGLVVFLHLDDAGSGTAVGADTYGNNGTLAGGTLTSAQACGSGGGFSGLAGDNCYVWRGTGFNDYVKINASASLNSTTAQMTLQAWIDPANTSPAPILEWNNGTNFGVSLWHSLGAPGDLYATLVDTNAAQHVIRSTGGYVHSGQWQLVTFTYDGATARLYDNDMQIASGTVGNLQDLQTGYPLYIGREPSSAYVYNGKIDEVRVFNTALQPSTVEGDPYGGVFKYKTTSSVSAPFTTIDLAAGNYNNGMTYGQTTPDTVIVSSVALAPGITNQLAFSFQDAVGNTLPISQPLSVVVSRPDTPVALQANVVSNSQIDWSWGRGARLCLQTDGTTHGEFKAYRPSDKTVLTGPQLATTFTQTGLSANSIDALAVSAVDAFGESALTAASTVYTQAVAPTTLTTNSVSTGSVVLGWTSANPAYTRFEVSLSLDNFATVLSTPVQISDDKTATSLSLSNLSPQTLYYVRVRAFNGQAGDVAVPGTSYTTFLTGSFETLPAAPGTLGGAAAGISSIQWSWTAVPTATSYTLQSSSGTTLAVLPGGTLSYTVTGLAANTAYGAQLKATNGSGAGSFGPVVTAYTDADQPTGTTVTSVSTDSAVVSWLPGVNPAGTSFQVQVATGSGFGALVQSPSTTSDSLTISGLLPASTYYTRVRATGFNGIASGFDSTLSFVTYHYGAISSTDTPATPYGLRPETVAAWHFDETGGTRAADSSGFGNDGTLSSVLSASTPAFVAGQAGLGDSVSFPGLSGSVMTAPNSASLAGTGDLTVEAWVKPANIVQVDDAGLVVKGTGGGETFALDVASDPALGARWRFAVRDGGGAYYGVESTQSARVAAWTHLAGVYKAGSPGTLALYVNGALTASAADAPASRLVSAAPVSVGSRQSAAAGYDRSFDGLIDEVHIETAALSAAVVGQDYGSAQPAVVVPPAPNGGVTLTVPPNTFGNSAVILFSSSPLTVPITVSPAILADGLASPPTGQTLVPGSVFEVVANVGGVPFTNPLGSTVTLSISYPDADDNGLVDGTSPPIPASQLHVYTLNTSVTRWEELPSTVDTVNHRVLGQTPHFSIFALFGPTGIKLNTDQVRVYPRPWRPGSGTRFDSATAPDGRTGLAIDNLPASGLVRIFTLSGQLVREIPFTGSDAGMAVWDGNNGAGRKAASGVYFAYVKGDDGSSTVVKFAVER